MNERERAKQMAEVMMHFANGGDVQSRWLAHSHDTWFDDSSPSWDLLKKQFRIKPRMVTVEFDPRNGEFGSHTGPDFVPRESISEAFHYDDEVWVRVPADLVDRIMKGEV